MLGPSRVHRQHGYIITMSCVIRHITVCVKFCDTCNTPVRYSEWDEGILNYNDFLFLSLGFFFHLLSNLQCHTAPGRAIRAHKIFLREPGLNDQQVLNAFISFLPLLDVDRNITCIFCGFFPWYLVADGNQKVGLDLDYEQLSRSAEALHRKHNDGSRTSTERSNGHRVDMDSFLSSYQEDAFFQQFGCSASCTPNMDTWGYWINQHTRETNEVVNTEFAKMAFSPKFNVQPTRRKPDNDTLVQQNLEPDSVPSAVTVGSIGSDSPSTESTRTMSSDRNDEFVLSNIMEFLAGACKSDIEDFCRRQGVSSVGSRRDMVIRLKDALGKAHNSSAFIKLFSNVFGRTGCHIDFVCPHLVSYASKICLRAESVRDYVDVLMSLKFSPTILCADMAGPIADHAKRRCPSMFGPKNGMWCEPTADNIRAAALGTFRVSAPWVNNIRQVRLTPDRERALNSEGRYPEMQVHPITLTAEKVALYDEFHQGNTTDVSDILRTVALCPDLEGLSKSTVSENYNNMRKRDEFSKSHETLDGGGDTQNAAKLQNCCRTNSKILRLGFVDPQRARCDGKGGCCKSW
eukprot:GILJ01027659.1.p1 GENE.GILJ01027659.1~~GILJ01027659.1.p1  ORF type:complete len:574 (-),score=24.48 GILJ01027659.1:681-2402(-)